ncbi:MAG: hypothetical protein QM775_22130 [Pirellulales bacterium]
MSALLAALEKLDFTHRAAAPESPTRAKPNYAAATLIAEPLGPAIVTAAQAPQVVVAASQAVLSPIVEPAVGTRAVAPVRDNAWSDSARDVLALFPAPAIVTVVGVGLRRQGVIDVEQLAAALAYESPVAVELLDAACWNDAELMTRARRSVLRRGVLAVTYLSAEAAVKRHALLAQSGGVLLLVESGATEARAADVTATTLRMQGVGVRGTLLLS